MWGSIDIGGVVLRETVTAEQDGDRITLAGQESHPPSTRDAVRSAHASIVAMPGLALPVSFTDKAELTGFYRVAEAASVLTDEQNGGFLTATWRLGLERIAPAVEMESRVTMIGRQDTLAGTQTPVFWHAPAVGALDYFTGPSVPSGSVVRQSADGPVRVHTGLPAGFAPRWTVKAADAMKGAARLILNGQRRLGRVVPPGASWEVHNGITRLRPGTDGRVIVDTWSQGAQEWVSPTVWRFVASTELTAAPELAVLRNEPEEVLVRLTYPQTTGRVTVDLGLRRGSRFVTGVMKRHGAAALAVVDDSAVDVTVETGGMRQTAADASGNRYVAGSANVSGSASGSLGRTATWLDFFIGHEVGASPQAGDAFADLLAQYLGSMGEVSKVVTR